MDSLKHIFDQLRQEGHLDDALAPNALACIPLHLPDSLADLVRSIKVVKEIPVTEVTPPTW